MLTVSLTRVSSSPYKSKQVASNPCYAQTPYNPLLTFTYKIRRFRSNNPSSCRCCSQAVKEQNSVQQLSSILQLEQCVSNEYPPTIVQAAGKVYAIGDLHGDMVKTLQCLCMAGLMEIGEDNKPIWTGGDSVVVQLGDVLDRGDQEIAIILLLRELDRQAREQNGAVYMLNGNHESLNVCLDFRYVTWGAFQEAALYYGLSEEEASVFKNQVEARKKLYAPGGLMSCILAENPTVLIVNDTLFAHGGVLPVHIDYGLQRINQEVCSWMRGERLGDGGLSPPPFLAMGDQNSIMWTRQYSKENLFPGFLNKAYLCNIANKVLYECGANRMVVGHTPQLMGCNSACSDRIWRVDVGMSAGVFDASPTVLEIFKDANGSTQTKIRTSLFDDQEN